jgi:hypothetical protein
MTVNEAGPDLYTETIGGGVIFSTTGLATMHYYVARAAAGAPISQYRLQQDGVDRPNNGSGGSIHLPMNLLNQLTAIGGGNGAGAGVYRDAGGKANCLIVYNADLTGADLTALNAILALHV